MVGNGVVPDEVRGERGNLYCQIDVFNLAPAEREAHGFTYHSSTGVNGAFRATDDPRLSSGNMEGHAPYHWLVRPRESHVPRR